MAAISEWRENNGVKAAKSASIKRKWHGGGSVKAAQYQQWRSSIMAWRNGGSMAKKSSSVGGRQQLAYVSA